MKKITFTYWRDGKFYIGFLNQYPDYQTQAKTKSELTENLKDLLKDIDSREVPYIRRVEEMLVA
jgi:predicted RNase H-like HicB family nuclease